MGFLGPSVRFCRAGLAKRKPQEGEIAPSAHPRAGFLQGSISVLVSAAWGRTDTSWLFPSRTALAYGVTAKAVWGPEQLSLSVTPTSVSHGRQLHAAAAAGLRFANICSAIAVVFPVPRGGHEAQESLRSD